MVNVSWHDAEAFCEWLSQRELRRYRLPTGDEWEFACRAGTATGAYFGDGNPDDFCWTFRNSSDRIPQVGQKRPNAFGLYDSLGNMMELCSEQGGRAVGRRGGHRECQDAYYRAASKEPGDRESFGHLVGFRVLCESTLDAAFLAERIRSETPAAFGLPTLQALATKYPHPHHAQAWHFGWGAFSGTKNRVTQFTPLPHFTGRIWQGGYVLPDAGLGYVSLVAEGGHPGDPQHAAIRRWTAPRSGFVVISGKLRHEAEYGDGVRGRIVSSRAGLLGEWPAKHTEAATDLPLAEVQPGDTIDFIADCIGDYGYDGFTWHVQVKLCDAHDRQIDCWDSAGDFHGPLGSSLAQQIAYAWRIAYQRDADSEELESACQFVSDQLAAPAEGDDKVDRELAALTRLCEQLLSHHEFGRRGLPLGRD